MAKSLVNVRVFFSGIIFSIISKTLQFDSTQPSKYQKMGHQAIAYSLYQGPRNRAASDSALELGLGEL